MTNGVTTLTESPFNKSNNYNTVHAKIHLRRDRDRSRPEQSTEKSEFPSKGFHLKWALKPRQQAGSKGREFQRKEEEDRQDKLDTTHSKTSKKVSAATEPDNDRKEVEPAWEAPARQLGTLCSVHRQ